jgi:hypothetical protein
MLDHNNKNGRISRGTDSKVGAWIQTLENIDDVYSVCQLALAAPDACAFCPMCQ